MQFIQPFPFIISFVIYIENIFSQSILTESLKFYVLTSVTSFMVSGLLSALKLSAVLRFIQVPFNILLTYFFCDI